MPGRWEAPRDLQGFHVSQTLCRALKFPLPTRTRIAPCLIAPCAVDVGRYCPSWQLRGSSDQAPGWCLNGALQREGEAAAPIAPVASAVPYLVRVLQVLDERSL